MIYNRHICRQYTHTHKQKKPNQEEERQVVTSVAGSAVFREQCHARSLLVLTTVSLIVCSEYGFAEKVVEGMFIIVNSITIKIHSKAFHASFELWQLQGYSVNPHWQQSDLRLTRITDPRRGEVTALAF